MKTFKEFIGESEGSVKTTLEKHGFKDTADQRGYGKPNPVYTPKGESVGLHKVAAMLTPHGFKRVTHYASGGPNSRMPDSVDHVYKKEHGCAGHETLSVSHDGTNVKHIIHTNSRSRD